MLTVRPGSIVRLEYELKAKDGQVIETSAKSGPIRYVHGEGKMLPALEKRLADLAVGQEKKGTIPSTEAFPEDSLPVQEMRKSEFPKGEKLEIGREFAAKGPTGAPVAFRISRIQGDKVEVRFVHPLAGKDLEFRVKVLGIDDPKSHMREGIAPPPPPEEALLDDADAVGLEEER